MDTDTKVAALAAVLTELEAKINKPFMEAFIAISEDMHPAGSRPCSTCRLVTNVIGQPFGCYAYQARKKAGG